MLFEIKWKEQTRVNEFLFFALHFFYFHFIHTLYLLECTWTECWMLFFCCFEIISVICKFWQILVADWWCLMYAFYLLWKLLRLCPLHKMSMCCFLKITHTHPAIPHSPIPPEPYLSAALGQFLFWCWGAPSREHRTLTVFGCVDMHSPVYTQPWTWEVGVPARRLKPCAPSICR